MLTPAGLRPITLTCAVAFLIAPMAALAAQPKRALHSGVDNFRLTAHDNLSYELYRTAHNEAVVLFSHDTQCPHVAASLPELAKLQKQYEDQGVAFMLLNAQPEVTREAVEQHASAAGITAPILLDRAQRIVYDMGITHTNEALVLDPSDEWRMVYRGAVAGENALASALAAHLAGDAIANGLTDHSGTPIDYQDPGELSYANDIVPILQEKCITCHVEGGIGPFAIDSHRDVLGWSDMMRETIRTRRMPPWHADPAYNALEEDRHLLAEEERALLAWIDSGARNDGEGDPLAELAGPQDDGWVLGEPDLVLELPEPEEIPAEGVIDYRYRYVATGLTEDKWIKGMQVKPTNLKVVHHALMFVVYPREYRHIQPEVRSGLSGYFGSYLPGGKISLYPESTGQFLPAGSHIVFQMHYNATGKPEVDQTKMALYFYDEPPERSLQMVAAHENDFTIPPKTEAHPVRAVMEFERDVELLGASPHMHYRGGRARMVAQLPGGENVPILNVPYYDFDWQPLYKLEEPVKLPAGTKAVWDGAFDNSFYNPKNPDPHQFVRFGEQSWEEMFIGYMEVAEPRRDEYFQPREYDSSEIIGYGEALNAETLVDTVWGRGRLRFHLKPGNVVVINDQFEAKWEVDGKIVRVVSPVRNFEASIVGDELFFSSRPLRRVR